MSNKSTAPRFRPGISGIQKEIQAKQAATDKNINTAFHDLKQLMEMAKDMVQLSKSITQKIAEKKGSITDDETVKLRSHFLSLGISGFSLSKNDFYAEDNYYVDIAKILEKILNEPLKNGGMVLLTEAYCRVNRALGMELISPEDLVNACELLAPLQLSIRLRIFDSGVMVIQSSTHDIQQEVKKTLEIVEEKGSITADEYSQQISVDTLLAREMLLYAEQRGIICRDDDIEGLRFYSNLFLSEQ